MTTRKLSRTKRIYYVGPVKCDYDEYDSMVVTATGPDQARELAHQLASIIQQDFLTAEVIEIGKAYEDVAVGIELASFNAG